MIFLILLIRVIPALMNAAWESGVNVPDDSGVLGLL